MKSFALILALLPFAASAATITVNTTADNTAAGDGKCTLREAIANVNAAGDTTGGDCGAGSGAGDTIRFGIGMPAKIRLKVGELLIRRDLSIENPAPGSLHIDGSGKSRVFEIAAGSTSMSGLSIERGSDPGSGGGILVDNGASLSLVACAFADNRVTSDEGSGGGAIYNAGTVNLTGCTLTRNRVTAADSNAGYGGGISNAGGALTLNSCTLTGNTVVGAESYENAGGAIYNDAGSVTLTKCVFAKNTVKDAYGDYNSGGALSTVGGTVTLDECTLTANRVVGGYATGGGIYDAGTVSLTNSMIVRNAAIGGTGVISLGGGIAVEDTEDDLGTASSASLSGCTLDRNLARTAGPAAESYGGAIYNDDTATLTNCTLTRNRVSVCNSPDCSATGGAIWGGNVTTLTNCTLSGNTAQRHDSHGEGSGGAIGGGGATLTNTILTNSGSSLNCETEIAVISGGHNLSSDGTCFTGGGTDLLHTKPQLAPLANNGGPTQTMALCTAPGAPAGCHAASPAIDAGDDAVTGPPDNLTTDQRGLPRLSGAHVDIGAYEVQ